MTFPWTTPKWKNQVNSMISYQCNCLSFILIKVVSHAHFPWFVHITQATVSTFNNYKWMPHTKVHIINVSVFNNHLINVSVLNVHMKMPIFPSQQWRVEKRINTECLLYMLANDKTLNRLLLVKSNEKTISHQVLCTISML